MISIDALRHIEDPKVLLLGNHAGIVQSILDFDYLANKQSPSIVAIVGVQQKQLRYFWGQKEVLIPGFTSMDEVSADVKQRVSFFAVAQSGRRAVGASIEAIRELPNVYGGMIFAEAVPERHALALRKVIQSHGKFVLGPASVGMAIGGLFKLGAIAGTLPDQIIQSGITKPGSTAVISTSGGMVNELISMVARCGGSVSFAAAIGGERFPLTKPVELVEQALHDEATKNILFFGEVGGTDEYEIAELLKTTQSGKKMVAYIAGVVAEKFASAPQFGHAKALAQNVSETASAKKEVLKQVGVIVADTFAAFEAEVRNMTGSTQDSPAATDERLAGMQKRSPSLFVNRISEDKGGEVKILGEPLLQFISDKSFTEIALNMFLGKKPSSRKLVDFFDMTLKILVDHGPQVSGAVNTMITARAGKDITAALATGILTIGPRFGGAINKAAESWFAAVAANENPNDFVETYAKNKQYISGIGHKKYRVDNPDPRVEALLAQFDGGGVHIRFAKEVAKITTDKKAQLILNVDGAIAAILLDLLKDEEHLSDAEIKVIIDAEFCNAIFVLARSVGFIAHYLEQKRLDESLFRLPDEDISSLSS